MEREAPALPVDIYRTIIGLVSLIYFWGLNSEWSLYTAPDGYLDHDMVRKIFWFARLTLYQPWMSDGFRYLLFLSGWLACLGVFLGWRPRLCAFWGWLVATSHFRWNFPVGYLDDSSIHLGLFWCMLLPTGTTLVWWKRPWHWGAWEQQCVPDGVCKVFVVNLCLGYWVTGLSKLTSRYWLEGKALYVALQLNISRTAGWWGIEALPILKVLNYSALLLECGLPLVFFLKPGSKLRLVGFLGACGLHLGIITTIGVNYANLCWLLCWVIVLREDLALYCGWARSSLLVARRWATRYAAVVVACIALAMSEGVPGLGEAYGLGFALQWSLGMSQEYHLFDWIDRFNFVVEDRATLDGKPLANAYPPGMRGLLLQSYLLDMRWMRLPRGQVGEWQRSLRERLETRLARRIPNGQVILSSRVTRVTLDNLDKHRWWVLEIDAFDIQNGKVTRLRQ